MAIVYQFPRVRDRAFIQKQAAWLFDLSPATAEKHLARQLQVQRETMRRRGIDQVEAERQVREIESAIRVAMSRFDRAPGSRL